MSHVIYLALVGLIGGTFGSMVGLGEGIHHPCSHPVPGVLSTSHRGSLVAVVATSTTAAALMYATISQHAPGHDDGDMTVTGRLVGSLVGVLLSKSVLSAVFGA